MAERPYFETRPTAPHYTPGVRIAFVSGNKEKLPDAVIPLGLLYIVASTPAQHERILIDLCFEARPEEALASKLREFQPDLVALGMRNIQNNDYSGLHDNIAYYARLLAVVRSVTPALVVLGGSGFSVMPRALMARLKPDYGVSGEGESAFEAGQASAQGGQGADAPR